MTSFAIKVVVVDSCFCPCVLCIRRYFIWGSLFVPQVTEVSTDRKRFLVSLKLSDCKPGNDAKGVCSGLDLLQDLLVERKLIMENLASKSGKRQKHFLIYRVRINLASPRATVYQNYQTGATPINVL